MGILIKNQFNELREALDEAFPNIFEFDQMVETGANHRRDSVTAGLGQSKPVIISAVISAAESDGWTRALIRAAVEANARQGANAGSQKLKDFITKHPELDPAKPPPELPDYYESVTLVAGQVFLRRPVIRQHLRNIGRDNNSHVMAIAGPRVTGKTYSRDFITFVLENDPEQRLKTQKVVYVDLDKLPPGPVEITRRIGKKLGLQESDLPKDKGEQATRLVGDFIDTVVDAVTNHVADIVWIVLDGFYTKQPPETDDFVTALVREANRNAKLRVVLLNYRLPPLIAPYALKEEIEAEPFNRDHMKEFITSVYKRSGKAYTDQSIDKAVDDVLQSVQEQLAAKPEDSDRRLEYLSSGLAIAAQRLAG